MQRFHQGCIAGLILLFAALSDAQLQKRTPYPVPLAKLSVSFNDVSGKLSNVRIIFEGSDDFALITPTTDEFTRITGNGRSKTIHAEQLDISYLVSDFEAEQIHKVIKSFISTLQHLEHDLQLQRFDRILYLDAYFPRFLRAFYYLCDASRNSVESLPRSVLVSESLFDVSQSSPKSDVRIQKWREQPDHILKLRIVCKELANQLTLWNKRLLKNDSHENEFFFDTKVKEAFTLFIRLYFNLPS